MYFISTSMLMSASAPDVGKREYTRAAHIVGSLLREEVAYCAAGERAELSQAIMRSDARSLYSIARPLAAGLSFTKVFELSRVLIREGKRVGKATKHGGGPIEDWHRYIVRPRSRHVSLVTQSSKYASSRLCTGPRAT
jgi:hypothetical protein